MIESRHPADRPLAEIVPALARISERPGLVKARPVAEVHHDEANLDALEAEAVRLARGDDIAEDVPEQRDLDRCAASARVLALIKASGLNRSEFADLLSLNEGALRLVPNKKGIPLPWWLETLIREQPELAAAFAAGVLRDVKASKRAKASNG